MYNTVGEPYDQGLRRYMTSIYNLMLGGLLVSAAVSAFSISSGLTAELKHGGILFWLVVLSPLALIFAMGFKTRSIATLHTLYWAFTALEGMSISVILSHYTGGSIATAFVASAAGFAGCSLYGYTTKRDLGPIGAFAIFALIGLIALMILNAFFPTPGFTLVVSLLGILLFAGLTAWDTQSLKDAYSATDDSNTLAYMVVMGALNLYLDFLNMFLFILRLTGVLSNDD